MTLLIYTINDIYYERKEQMGILQMNSRVTCYYSEEHANDLAQHIGYSELHGISSYSEQDAECSE